MIKPDDRETLLRTLGDAVMTAQEQLQKDGYAPEDGLPEIISGLLSLAYDIAKNAAGLDKARFLLACTAATEDKP